MAEAPVIVPYRAEQREALFSLWRRYFGAWSARQLERRWRWQFEQNPFCAEREPVILLAMQGEDVVGHISGIPLPMRVDGQRAVGWTTSGLVVDERYRWLAMRLFAALFAHVPMLGRAEEPSLKRMCERNGAIMAPASRQRFEYPLGHSGQLCRALRWRLPRQLAWLAQPWMAAALARFWRPPNRPPARPLPPRAAPDGGGVRRIERFGEDYDALWQRVRPRWQWSLDKDARYMNWRYVDCPTLHPVRLGWYDAHGAVRAVAVGIRWARADRWRNPCGSYGEVAELIVDEPTAGGATDLLAETIWALAAHGVDSVGCAWLCPDLQPAVEKIGFTRSDADMFEIGFAPGKGMTTPGPRSWYYSAADSDALYSPGL